MFLNPFVCRHCGVRLSSLDSMRRHTIRHKNKYQTKVKRSMMLKRCGSSHFHPKPMSKPDTSCIPKSYLQTPTGQPHKCTFCLKWLPSRDHLEVHILIHTNKNQFKCEFCDGCFTAHKYLIKHHNNHHAKTTSYICVHCLKCFASCAEMNTHVKTHTIEINLVAHTNKKPRKLCKHCSKSFACNKQLTKHMNRAHTLAYIDENQFQCDYCPRRFTNERKLENHIYTHNKEKPYQCADCHKRFTSQQVLSRHAKTHTRKKPACDYCGKVYATKWHLESHIQTNHIKEKPYLCDICGLCSATYSLLKSHMKCHFKEYQCEYCGKRFTQSGVLKHHIRTHTKEKPYKCEFCSNCFASSGTLVTHIRTHTKEKPYHCEYCPSRFAQISDRKKHIRTHFK